MEALQKLARYIQSLNQRQFQRFLLLTLGSIVVVTLLFVYYLYEKKADLITTINQLQVLSKKGVTLIQDHKLMQKEEQRLKEILEKNRDFTIKGFFERFCKEQDINPEQGWDTRPPETIGDQFEEILLTATIRHQTMEKLVQVLTALDKEEIVYIKELVIHNEGSSKISFDLVIATRKYKALTD